MTSRSEATLGTVSPLIADKVRAAAGLLQNQMQLLVYSGLRDAAQQNALYSQGRTEPGKIVTNARAGQSMHNYGLAVDVVPYLKDTQQPNWDANSPDFKLMVTTLKEQGLAWGGDWIHFKDMDHFQLATLPANPNAAMEHDYSTLDLPTIWSHAEAGKYA